jgi:predicted transcriptional regulator
MARRTPSPKLPRPTDAELAILRVLWQRGPSTVRDVHTELSRAQTVGYTTVLKLLQIMTAKGLVRRTEAGRQHVYQPTLSEEQTQRQVVEHVLDRVFGGATHKLVLQALSARRAAPEELAEIRRLLHNLETDTP